MTEAQTAAMMTFFEPELRFPFLPEITPTCDVVDFVELSLVSVVVPSSDCVLARMVLGMMRLVYEKMGCMLVLDIELVMNYQIIQRQTITTV